MVKNSINEELNQNKGVITLTEEQHDVFTHIVAAYTLYTITIGGKILEISQQCKSVNARFKSKNSKLNEIEDVAIEIAKKHIEKIVMIYEKLYNTPTVFSIVDCTILKDGLLTFLKEYKEVFEKYKEEVQSKTGAFDAKLEEINELIENSRPFEEMCQFILEIEKTIENKS